MKKIIFGLTIALVAISGLVLANREIKSETPKKSNVKPVAVAESKAALKKWEATPDGIFFKKWEASPAGLKIQAAAAKINKSIKDNSNIEGVVTSLSLPEGSRLGFGVMVNIKGDDYILSFGPELNKEFAQLHTLKVNDKIGIKTKNVTKAPKYAYPIVAGELIERNGKILYKRAPNKGGC